MQHPTRLPKKRPPTVAELREQLAQFPDDVLVVGINLRLQVVAPVPVKWKVFKDKAGRLFAHKIDADTATNSVDVVKL
jgi:hypothetical protein